jgi:ribonucleoside-diphosphate reductase subunit M1
VPVLKVFDAAMDVMDQSANKRPSAISVYIEPWHADILSFVRMKRHNAVESDRIKKLFHALWVNDLLSVFASSLLNEPLILHPVA